MNFVTNIQPTDDDYESINRVINRGSFMWFKIVILNTLMKDTWNRLSTLKMPSNATKFILNIILVFSILYFASQNWNSVIKWYYGGSALIIYDS